jgi:ribosome assembly protein YihI (activator of Der GTPase)
MAKKDDTMVEEKLDRIEFFKKIREDIIEKLGIPKDTRPENVLKVLELQEQMAKISRNKKTHH